MRVALLSGLLCLGACAPKTYTVARTIDGQREVGTFVSPFAYEHFVRAELAAGEEDGEAVELYELARAGAADDAYVASRQAEAEIRLGRLDAAERTLAEAEALEPDTEELWLATADLRLARDDGEGAMEALVRAARLDPSSPTPVLRIAERLAEDGAAQRALALLAEGPQNHPAVLRAQFALALERRDAGRAASAAERLAARVPLMVSELVRAARAALDAERPALAARLLASPALDREPGVPTLRIETLLALGEMEAAEALLLSTSPDALGGRGEAARLLLALGRPEMARDMAAVGLSDAEPGAATALGDALLELEGPGPAAGAFAEARGIAEPRSRAREGLAEALAASGRPALGAEITGPVR